MIREATFYAELGRRLQSKRKELDMTQESLADKVGLTRTSITNIEKGRQKVLSHLLVQLAEALNTPLVDLLPREDSAAKALDALPDPVMKRWISNSVESNALTQPGSNR